MFRTYETNRIKEFLKQVGFRHLGFGRPDYPYMLDPIQLTFLVNQVDNLYRELQRPINIYEIGVARGMTSAFLAQHIMSENLPHKIKCLDTFSGFTSADMKFEIQNRQKSRSELLGFSYNDYDVWVKNFSAIDCVEAIQCDASSYSIPADEVVDIVLADVDLYLPTINILRNFYPRVTCGGAIIVDDVKENSCWDGAHQAYFEFCKETDITPELLGRKSGILRKTV